MRALIVALGLVLAGPVLGADAARVGDITILDPSVRALLGNAPKRVSARSRPRRGSLPPRPLAPI